MVMVMVTFTLKVTIRHGLETDGLQDSNAVLCFAPSCSASIKSRK